MPASRSAQAARYGGFPCTSASRIRARIGSQKGDFHASDDRLHHDRCSHVLQVKRLCSLSWADPCRAHRRPSVAVPGKNPPLRQQVLPAEHRPLRGQQAQCSLARAPKLPGHPCLCQPSAVPGRSTEDLLLARNAGSTDPDHRLCEAQPHAEHAVRPEHRDAAALGLVVSGQRGACRRPSRGLNRPRGHRRGGGPLLRAAGLAGDGVA